MIRRREFITGLGGALGWPVVARAQQPTMPVIGYLSAQSADDDYKNMTVPFLQGLKEAGYVDGQNVAIEYRWAENQIDRLRALAADLVSRRVAVIVARGAMTAVPAYLPPALTQSHQVLSPASACPAGTSPASPFWRPSWRRNDCNCSTI